LTRSGRVLRAGRPSVLARGSEARDGLEGFGKATGGGCFAVSERARPGSGPVGTALPRGVGGRGRLGIRGFVFTAIARQVDPQTKKVDTRFRFVHRCRTQHAVVFDSTVLPFPAEWRHASWKGKSRTTRPCRPASLPHDRSASTPPAQDEAGRSPTTPCSRGGRRSCAGTGAAVPEIGLCEPMNPSAEHRKGGERRRAGHGLA